MFDEQAAIQSYIAEKGVTKCPPAFVWISPQGERSPTDGKKWAEYEPAPDYVCSRHYTSKGGIKSGQMAADRYRERRRKFLSEFVLSPTYSTVQQMAVRESVMTPNLERLIRESGKEFMGDAFNPIWDEFRQDKALNSIPNPAVKRKLKAR